MVFFFWKNKNEDSFVDDILDGIFYDDEEVVVMNEGIPYDIFKYFVKTVAMRNKRIKSYFISDWIVYCEVISNSGLTSWDFKVDFTDLGGYPEYSISTEKSTSTLPEYFAKEVIDLVDKYRYGEKKVYTSENDIYCWKCGKLNSKEDPFCNYCGAQQDRLEESYVKLKLEQERNESERIRVQEEEIRQENEFRERQAIRDVELAREQAHQEEIRRENAKQFQKFLLKLLPYILLALGVYFLFKHEQYIQQRNREAEVVEAHRKDGDIELSFSHFDFENKEDNKNNPVKYNSVKSDFQNAGFKNIELQKQKDLGFFDRKKEGNVISVSINGNSNFSKGDWFPKNAKIKITYHARK